MLCKVRFAPACLAAAMAIGAVASASASASAGWMVNGTQLSGSAAIMRAELVNGSAITLSSSVVSISCEAPTIEAEASSITSPSAGQASSVTFNECSSTTEHCELAETSVTTSPLQTSEVVLEGSSGVRGLFIPQTKTTFATVKFNGELCAVAGTQPITGKVDWLAPKGQEERTAQLLLVLALAGQLKIGSSEAHLQFSYLQYVEGNKAWRYL